MSGKYALIIGNTEYTDSGLAQLTAPGKDAEDFARVLQDREIGAFDEVNILLNQPEPIVRGAIDEFFDLKKPDDLLVLYFSGHGVRDELGALYLAVKNTIRSRLRSTAVKSDYIREAMDQSRSKRQVLILDCCNSGAFAQGTKAATGVSIGTASAFEAGYGRIILTASDSTQFAWEGNKVIGETDNSLFTHFLVEGLEGEADLDGDGRITVDELYDYAYEKVRFATPKQTPSKFSSKQQGEIVLRQNMRIEDIKPVSLPDELIEATEDSRTFVREGAVQQLGKLLKSKNLGLARSAREALEKIVAEDDSYRVRQAATQVLEPIRQAEQKAEEERKAREEAEHIAIVKAEEERFAREKAETERLLAEQKAEKERKAREEAQRLAREKAKTERQARAEAKLKAKQEAERLEAQKAEEEHITREKVETERKAKEKAERLAIKAEDKRKVKQAKMDGEHSIAQPHVQKQIIADMTPFLFSWQGRILLGAILGLLFGLMNILFFSIYYEDYYRYISELLLDALAFAFMCGLGGLIAYPHKLSIVSIFIGFLIAGIIGYAVAHNANIASSYLPFNFLAFGAIVGVPAGALVSRILYMLRIGEHSIAQPNVQKQIIADTAPFFFSWRGRLLLGVILGLFLGLLNTIFFSIYYENYFRYTSALVLDTVAFAFICGLAGLITYPHKLSIVPIVIGFLSAGIIGYVVANNANIVSSYLPFNFLAFGTFLGVPAGALVSRILSTPKIMK